MTLPDAATLAPTFSDARSSITAGVHMRSLCLVVLTLCATSAEAQPTLARDRAPAVPAEIRQFVDRLYAANASVRAEAACQLRKQHRDATAAISVLLSMLADDITVPAIECHMSEWLRR